MRYSSKTMKNIRSCQPENKPESTEFDQHVEIPNKCFGDGFRNRHKNIGDIPRRKNKRTWSSAISAKYRLWQPWNKFSMFLLKAAEGTTWRFLGWASSHFRKKHECRYVELIRLHILVNCMELRWRQPCSDPVAPCNIHWEIKCWSFQEYRVWKRIPNKWRSFTSVQMFHTHTPRRSRVTFSGRHARHELWHRCMASIQR